MITIAKQMSICFEYTPLAYIRQIRGEEGGHGITARWWRFVEIKTAQQWGGLLNAIAVLVFLANTLRAIRYQ